MMGKGFVCLCYHRVAPVGGARVDAYTVRADRFRRQMAWLAARGHVGRTISDVLDDGRGLALSFDDGYADFYEEAWPVLQEHGFRATLFPVAGWVGGVEDGTRMMDWEALGELAASGCEIGAHGLMHRPLDVATESELRDEVAAARQLITHHIGVPPTGIAYPYGRTLERVERVAAEAGFAWGATARGGRNHPNTPPLRLRRTLVRAGDAGFSFALKAATGYASFTEVRMDLLGLP